MNHVRSTRRNDHRSGSFQRVPLSLPRSSSKQIGRGPGSQVHRNVAITQGMDNGARSGKPGRGAVASNQSCASYLVWLLAHRSQDVHMQYPQTRGSRRTPSFEGIGRPCIIGLCVPYLRCFMERRRRPILGTASPINLFPHLALSNGGGLPQSSRRCVLGAHKR